MGTYKRHKNTHKIMKRTNCKTDELEIERKKVKIKGKSQPQEIRTKKVVCDLVEEEATEKPDQICINKESFESILDRIQRLLEEPITEENDTERKDRLFAGYADLRRLSKGIAEKKKPKKKNCTPGNVWHDKKTGKLTDKAGAGSWSLQQVSKEEDCTGKKAGVARVVGGRELFTKLPCGRANRDNKCGTKAEQMISEELKLRWAELLRN